MVIPVAVSFAGSGLLLLYYTGVALVFSQQGVIKPGETPLGGVSGGAVIAVQTCAGVPFQQQFMSLRLVWAYCQVNYPGDPVCGGAGGPLLREAIYQNIKTYGTQDALRRCRDTLTVALSELKPLDTIIKKPLPWAFSKPTSIEELADVAAASSFKPCSMAGLPVIPFRGRPVIDGGYTSGFSQTCDPAAKVCIKVSALQVGPNNPLGPTWYTNCPALAVNLPLAPNSKPSGPISDKPVPRAQWKLPQECQYDPETGAILAPELPQLAAPGLPTETDIYPGFQYNALAINPCDWLSWILNVQAMTPDNIQAVFEQGKDDAVAYLKAKKWNQPK